MLRLIKRDRIYTGKLISLNVNTYADLDGNEMQREFIEHPGAAVVIPVVSKDEVILVEQFRVGAGRKLLEFPAGCIDKGEDPRQTAARELEEETGMKAGKLESLFSMYPSAGILNEQMHIFLATQLEDTGKQTLDEDEDVEIVRMSFKDLRTQMRAGNIKDGKTLAALGWLFSFRPSFKD